MISPIETPSVSPWTIERTKERIAGVSARTSMFFSASFVDRPMFCSCSVSRSSSPSGPSELLGGDPQRAAKPSPASTVTTSTSISSGSS